MYSKSHLKEIDMHSSFLKDDVESQALNPSIVSSRRVKGGILIITILLLTVAFSSLAHGFQSLTFKKQEVNSQANTKAITTLNIMVLYEGFYPKIPYPINEKYEVDPSKIESFKVKVTGSQINSPVQFVHHDFPYITVVPEVFVSSQRAADLIKIGSEISSGTFLFTIETPKFNFGVNEQYYTSITVNLPHNLSSFNEIDIKVIKGSISCDLNSKTNLTSLHLETTSSSINLKNQIAEQLTLKSISGSISAYNFSAGLTQAATVSGSIKIEEADSDYVNIKASSGSIRIDDLITKKCTLNTISGSIRAQQLILSDLYAKTISGSIHAETSEFGSNKLFLSKGSSDHINQTKLASGMENAIKIELSTISGSSSLRLPISYSGAFNIKSVSGSAIMNSLNNDLHFEINKRNYKSGFKGDSSSSNLIVGHSISGNQKIIFE